jgi:imidazolonepropionase-like amidohydrolase
MSESLTIVNALIYDGIQDEPFHGDIRIESGIICEIGAIKNSFSERFDARGAVVTPGFIDCHFHAYGIGLDTLKIESLPLSYLALEGSKRLSSALRRGFTTVRDPAGGDIGLALAIKNNVFDSPRYLYTGAALSQTGGHGDARPAESAMCFTHSHLCEVIDGVENLRVAVRERIRKGAHAIKIMTSGGVVSPSDPIRIPQYSSEEVRAVCEEATRRGTYVAAHAYSPEAIHHSIDNGVRTIEHGNLLDQSSAKKIAENEAFLVPTLVAYHAMAAQGKELGMSITSISKNEEVLVGGFNSIEIAKKNKVKIGFGSDLMGPLESEQLRGIEIHLEVQTVAELLKSITATNADIIMRNDLGRICPGNIADLLILDGNPWDDVSSLWRITQNRKIIKAGKILKI